MRSCDTMNSVCPQVMDGNGVGVGDGRLALELDVWILLCLFDVGAGRFSLVFLSFWYYCILPLGCWCSFSFWRWVFGVAPLPFGLRDCLLSRWDFRFLLLR